jgi:K+/H+ antiporter YhaU regulatory subunit KhtT
MKDENVLELLEIYMDMVEKQDEIIQRMGKILEEKMQEVQRMRNVEGFFPDEESTNQDERILEECIEQYNEAKGTTQ